MEDARSRAKPRHSHRDLCRRSRDPMPAGQSRRGLVTTARDHGKAEADGQRGQDTNLQGDVNKAYRPIDNDTAVRLRRWLRIKHKVRRRKGGTYPLSQPLRVLRTRTLDGAWPRRVVDEGVKSCPRAGCGSSARPVRSPPDERGGNIYVQPTATAPHLDSTHLR